MTASTIVGNSNDPSSGVGVGRVGRSPKISALVSDAEVWTQDGDFSDFAHAVDVVRI
jgi:hypothetical protein